MILIRALFEYFEILYIIILFSLNGSFYSPYQTIPVQQIFLGQDAVSKPLVVGSLAASPNVLYLASVEVVRADLDASSEFASITINGEDFGTCNPTGSNDCSWALCSDYTSNGRYNRAISSATGSFTITAQFSDQVDSGGSTCDPWKTYGIVRFTLERGSLIYIILYL